MASFRPIQHRLKHRIDLVGSGVVVAVLRTIDIDLYRYLDLLTEDIFTSLVHAFDQQPDLLVLFNFSAVDVERVMQRKKIRPSRALFSR